MKKKRIFITAATAILGLSLVGAVNADTIDAVGKSMPQKAQQSIYMAQEDHEPMKGLRLTDEKAKDNGTTTEILEASNQGSKSNSSMQWDKDRTMHTKDKEEQMTKMDLEKEQMAEMGQMGTMEPMHNDMESMQELMESMHESMPSESMPHSNNMPMHSDMLMEKNEMRNHMMKR